LPFAHGSRARVYVNGYDLTGYLKSFSSGGQADVLEATVFSKREKEYVPGLKDGSLSAEGLFDGDTGAVDETVAAALGSSSSLWLWFPQGESAVGSDGYGFDAIATAYEVSTPVEDLAAITVEAQSRIGRERVKSLHPLSQETAGTNGTTIDNGAASSDGAVAVLQVTAISGTSPTLDVTVQHSPDGTTWTDLIAFTQVSAAHQAERKTVTGSVDQHVRAIWTLGGTNPAATFTVAFGRN